MGRESDVRWRGVGAVGLGHMARQDFARGMHRHVALSRGPVTGHCYRVKSQGTVTGHPSQGIDTGYRHRVPVTGYQSQDTGTEYRLGAPLRRYCHGSTSQRHINKDTPDDFSSGVSEERQLPTLPPGLAVPSAMTGLASLFGMGRGGSPSL